MAALLVTVTNFGDLAVLLPIVGIIPLWLIGVRFPRAALWWAVAAALCIGSTALLKIYFYSCPPFAELRSPSGHTSLSTLVYGGIAVIIAAEGTRWHRLLSYAAGAALIAVIAISRVLLQAHSPLETGFGLVIGSIALAVFARKYLGHRPAVVSLRPLIVAVALLLITLHGHELRAEELLHAIGIYLQIASLACA
jgi:membrane-associated phospholipid phosphatase